MSRSDEERVADILDAAAELAEAVGQKRFLRSALHVRAAERLLEIIGEASNALSDELHAAHPEVAWRDITALRILLAHHYHRIDPDQVWQIATGSVPALARHLRA
ncbi:MAG TPA: HepT-like ribonuclease domain-containing protein [Iamia sp.]|nr:HepT-like ribonuclease domain-containing protein [Iamia sp.]